VDVFHIRYGVVFAVVTPSAGVDKAGIDGDEGVHGVTHPDPFT
jgi:hypothetical protein